MKKYLYLTIAVMMVIATTGVCYGQLHSHGPDDSVSTEVIASTSAGSGNITDTSDMLSASSCTSANRLLGYFFSAPTAGIVSIFDSSSAANSLESATGLILEDSCTTGDSHTVFFPFPIAISNTIYVYFTQSDSVLILYYE